MNRKWINNEEDSTIGTMTCTKDWFRNIYLQHKPDGEWSFCLDCGHVRECGICQKECNMDATYNLINKE